MRYLATFLTLPTFNSHSSIHISLELKRRVAVILRLRKPRLFSIDKRRRKRNDSNSHRSSSSSQYIIRILCNPHIGMNEISTAAATEEVFLSATTIISQPPFVTNFQLAHNIYVSCVPTNDDNMHIIYKKTSPFKLLSRQLSGFLHSQNDNNEVKIER